MSEMVERVAAGKVITVEEAVRMETDKAVAELRRVVADHGRESPAAKDLAIDFCRRAMTDPFAKWPLPCPMPEGSVPTDVSATAPTPPFEYAWERVIARLCQPQTDAVKG